MQFKKEGEVKMQPSSLTLTFHGCWAEVGTLEREGLWGEGWSLREDN